MNTTITNVAIENVIASNLPFKPSEQTDLKWRHLPEFPVTIIYTQKVCVCACVRACVCVSINDSNFRSSHKNINYVSLNLALGIIDL